MTVKELILKLQHYPSDSEVIFVRQQSDTLDCYSSGMPTYHSPDVSISGEDKTIRPGMQVMLVDADDYYFYEDGTYVKEERNER